MTTEELLECRIKQLDKKKDLISRASTKLKESRKKNAIYFNRKHNIRSEPLKVGDMVLQFDNTIGKQRHLKLSNRWYGPYIVTKDNKNGSYYIKELDGAVLRTPVAGNRLKKFFQNDISIHTVSIRGGEMSQS
ncbi:hypothetical protein AYI70_g4281 [Smittium culicis]|uniref:Retrovirus-related Pol polyprotein from transposon n=1 Tax=Smittium culicis TaxID=133412 RepID=A0A1R1XZZ4_9FUNG|nr:hypothetical protein AYI70_g4281 [Smittium culicis]